MIEGYNSQDHVNITKYGFEDGTYAIGQKDSSTVYYNLYSPSGNLIFSTRDTVKQFDTFEPCDCPKVQFTYFKYPAVLAEFGLEGIVIIRLRVGTDGKLIEIEPVKGFHEDAIRAAVQSLKKVSCYGVALKNNIPVAYDLMLVVHFELTGDDASRMGYKIEYKCGQ